MNSNPSSCRAGDIIRQFAFGRGARILAMLEAYLDDSGTHGGPHCFVAGYAATTEAWAAFAEEWNALCVRYLRGRPFKTVAAYREKDPGFVPEDGRVKFARCIADHVEIELWSALPEHYAAQIEERYEVRFKKYELCFWGLIEKVVRDSDLLARKDALAWTFDHQGGAPPDQQSELESALLRAFNEQMNQAGDESRHLFRAIAFADDKYLCQLQAADFLAWHKRRRHADGADVPERPAYSILASAPLKRLEKVWFDHTLEELLERLTRPQEERE